MSRAFHRWGRPEPVYVIPDPPDPDACTTVEAQASVPDLHYYRPAETDCEHGATLTFRTCLLGGHPVTFDTPLTYCFDCHALAPTPQENPQP